MTFIALPFPRPWSPSYPTSHTWAAVIASWKLLSVYLCALSPSPINPSYTQLIEQLFLCMFPIHKRYIDCNLSPQELVPLVTGRATLCHWWWLGSGPGCGSFSPRASWSCPLCGRRGAPIPLGQLPPFCLVEISQEKWKQFPSIKLGPCKLSLSPFLKSCCYI